MRKTILGAAIICGLFTNNHNSSAQTFTWAEKYDDSGYVSSAKTAMDRNGNTYVTGSYNSAVTLGGTTFTPPYGGLGYCLLKYDTSGHIVWARGGGSGHINQGYGVCTDAAGNVYVAGTFHNSITFGSTTLVATDTDFISANLFVVKYDPTGTPLWAVQSSGYCHVYSPSIYIDAHGSVYVTSQFDVSVTLGTTALSGSGQGFVAKYNPSGGLQWAVQSDGSGYFEPHGITADARGNVYVTGELGYAETLGGLFVPGHGHGGECVARYDSMGNAVWAVTNGANAAMAECEGTAIRSDGGRYVYVAGNMDTSRYGTITLPAVGASFAYLAKYDTTGSLIWVKTPTGSTGMQCDASDLTSDSTGHLLIAGDYAGTIRFDTLSPMTSSTGASSNVFVVKYDSSGKAIWSVSAGSTGTNTGESIATNGKAISISGTYSNPAAFGPITLTSARSFATSFLAHLTNGTGLTTGIDATPTAEHILSLYPNPATGTLFIQSAGMSNGYIYELYDMAGHVAMDGILTPSIDVSGLPEGLYILKVSISNLVITKKVSILRK